MIEDDLLTSIGEHTVVVEINPAVQIRLSGARVGDVDGHAESRLTLNETRWQRHAVFVIRARGVIARCR